MEATRLGITVTLAVDFHISKDVFFFFLSSVWGKINLDDLWKLSSLWFGTPLECSIKILANSGFDVTESKKIDGWVDVFRHFAPSQQANSIFIYATLQNRSRKHNYLTIGLWVRFWCLAGASRCGVYMFSLSPTVQTISCRYEMGCRCEHAWTPVLLALALNGSVTCLI